MFKGFLPECKKYLSSFSQYHPIYQISSVSWRDSPFLKSKHEQNLELNYLVVAKIWQTSNIKAVRANPFCSLQKHIVVLRVLLSNYYSFYLIKIRLIWQEHRSFNEIYNSYWCSSLSHTVYTTLSHICGLDKEMVLDAFDTQGEKEQHAELNSSTQSHTSTDRRAGFKLCRPNTWQGEWNVRSRDWSCLIAKNKKGSIKA